MHVCPHATLSAKGECKVTVSRIAQVSLGTDSPWPTYLCNVFCQSRRRYKRRKHTIVTPTSFHAN